MQEPKTKAKILSPGMDKSVHFFERPRTCICTDMRIAQICPPPPGANRVKATLRLFWDHRAPIQ